MVVGPAGRPQHKSVALGDVDGDSDLDLVCGNFNQFSTVYINDGGTLQTSPAWSLARSGNTRAVALADVEGDGDPDIVCGVYGDSTIYFAGKTAPDFKGNPLSPANQLPNERRSPEIREGGERERVVPPDPLHGEGRRIGRDVGRAGVSVQRRARVVPRDHRRRRGKGRPVRDVAGGGPRLDRVGHPSSRFRPARGGPPAPRHRDPAARERDPAHRAVRQGSRSHDHRTGR